MRVVRSTEAFRNGKKTGSELGVCHKDGTLVPKTTTAPWHPAKSRKQYRGLDAKFISSFYNSSDPII